MGYLHLLQDDDASTSHTFLLCFNLICEMINFIGNKLQSELESGLAHPILQERLNTVRGEINQICQNKNEMIDAFAQGLRKSDRLRKIVQKCISEEDEIKSKDLKKICERKMLRPVQEFIWQCLFVLNNVVDDGGQVPGCSKIDWSEVKKKLETPLDRRYGPGENSLYDDNLDVSKEQAPYEDQCALCFTGISMIITDDGYVFIEDMKCCTICRLAFYCSKECQTKHWKAGHKKVCKPGLGVSKSKERKRGKKKAKATDGFQRMVDNGEVTVASSSTRKD